MGLAQAEPLFLFREEHASISAELSQIDELFVSLESSGNRRGERILNQLIEPSNHLSERLKGHLDREEKSFFPVLEARLGKDRGIIEVMKREHKEILRSLNAFEEELDRMVKERDTRKTWNLSSYIQELRASLSDHMSREERIVFWLAELRLSQPDNEKIISNLQSMTTPSPPLTAT